MIKILDADQVPLSEILARPEDKRDISGAVANIIEDVRQNGDAALRRYTKEFDKAEPDTLEVPMGAMSPLQVGGETMTVSRHPAILAGMQSMSTVEGRGAVPPGIYTPTFSMGVTFWPRRMPGLSLMTQIPPYRRRLLRLPESGDRHHPPQRLHRDRSHPGTQRCDRRHRGDGKDPSGESICS